MRTFSGSPNPLHPSRPGWNAKSSIIWRLHRHPSLTGMFATPPFASIAPYIKPDLVLLPPHTSSCRREICLIQWQMTKNSTQTGLKKKEEKAKGGFCLKVWQSKDSKWASFSISRLIFPEVALFSGRLYPKMDTDSFRLAISFFSNRSGKRGSYSWSFSVLVGFHQVTCWSLTNHRDQGMLGSNWPDWITWQGSESRISFTLGEHWHEPNDVHQEKRRITRKKMAIDTG